MITIEQMFEAFQPELKALIQQKVLSRQDASDIGSALARIAVDLRAASPAAPEREELVRRLVDLADEWEQPSGENLSPQAAIIDFLHGDDVASALSASGPSEEAVKIAKGLRSRGYENDYKVLCEEIIRLHGSAT